MKLKFEVREPATFFHFLDSISSWSIHTTKSIRKYYEEKFGISKEDNVFIKRYIKIRKKYQWGALDSDFYLSKNFKEARNRLKKRLKKKEYEELIEIIDHFYPDIHKIFLEWKKYLIQRKKQLENEVKKHDLKGLFKEVAHFYERKNHQKTVTVHLVVNPEKRRSGGGANIVPKEHITSAPQDLKSKHKRNLHCDISVIAHETLHLIEGKWRKKRWNDFKRFAGRNKIDVDILREAIADTLVPDGYLALKYELINDLHILNFNKIKKISKKNKSEYYRKSRWKLSAMIYPLTKKQFEKDKSIFEGDYLKKCMHKYIEMRKKS